VVSLRIEDGTYKDKQSRASGMPINSGQSKVKQQKLFLKQMGLMTMFEIKIYDMTYFEWICFDNIWSTINGS
jgi:hypothetical protein